MLLHSLSRARQETMREGCPPVEEARAIWLDDLLLSGKSPSTLQGYRSTTRNLEALTPDAARAVIRGYIGSNTALLAWAALRSLAACAQERGWTRESFMDGVPRPAKRRTPHRYLTATEIRRVYAACQDDRERLIVRLLLTGPRAAELLQIAPELVQDGAIRIRGKGGRYRLIPLDDETAALLVQVGQPIRPTQGRAGYVMLHRLVQALGVRAGIPHLHPHLFRHSWASAWMIAGGDSLTLQTLGGWSSQEMVERYSQSALELASAQRAREMGLIAKLLE